MKAQGIEVSGHALYVPGATVNRLAIEGTVLPVFAKRFGGVDYYGSAISSDAPNLDWAEEMAGVTLRHAQRGLVKVLGSAGATQDWMANKDVRQLWRERQGDKDEDFFDREDVRDNLRIVALGASGLAEGLTEKVAYPLRAATIDRPWQRGLQALGAFPPPVEQIAPEEVSDVLHRYSNVVIGRELSSRANTSQGFTTLLYEGVRDNMEYLTSNEAGELRRHNDELAEALTAGDEKAVKKNIISRGQSFHRPVQWVHRGPAFAEESRLGGDVPVDNWQQSARRNLGLLARSNGARPMQELRRFHERGITVDFIVPAFDTIVPLETIVNFFNGDVAQAQEHTRLLPIGSHPVFHAQPELVMQWIAPAGSR